MRDYYKLCKGENVILYQHLWCRWTFIKLPLRSHCLSSVYIKVIGPTRWSLDWLWLLDIYDDYLWYFQSRSQRNIAWLCAMSTFSIRLMIFHLRSCALCRGLNIRPDNLVVLYGDYIHDKRWLAKLRSEPWIKALEKNRNTLPPMQWLNIQGHQNYIFWEYREYTKFCGWTQPWPLID